MVCFNKDNVYIQSSSFHIYRHHYGFEFSHNEMIIKIYAKGKIFEIDTDRVKASLIEYTKKWGGSIVLKVTDIAEEDDLFEWIKVLEENGLTIWLVIQKR